MRSAATPERTKARWGVWSVAAALAVWVGGCGIFGSGDGGSEPSGPSESGDESPSGGASDVGESESSGESASASEEPVPDTGLVAPPTLAGGSGDAGASARNPFAPQVEVDREDDEEDEDERGAEVEVSALKKYPLEEYRLVGIISEVAVPKAMFIAPDGKGYLVKETEVIGSEGGTVRDIRNNAVELEVPRGDEGAEPKSMTLELRKRELGTEDDSELTPRERETLEELMESEQGREAVRESFDKKAPAANTAEEGREGRPKQKRRRRESTGERRQRRSPE